MTGSSRSTIPSSRVARSRSGTWPSTARACGCPVTRALGSSRPLRAELHRGADAEADVTAAKRAPGGEVRVPRTSCHGRPMCWRNVPGRPTGTRAQCITEPLGIYVDRPRYARPRPGPHVLREAHAAVEPRRARGRRRPAPDRERHAVLPRCRSRVPLSHGSRDRVSTGCCCTTAATAGFRSFALIKGDTVVVALRAQARSVNGDAFKALRGGGGADKPRLKSQFRVEPANTVDTACQVLNASGAAFGSDLCGLRLLSPPR